MRGYILHFDTSVGGVCTPRPTTRDKRADVTGAPKTIFSFGHTQEKVIIYGGYVGVVTTFGTVLILFVSSAGIVF